MHVLIVEDDPLIADHIVAGLQLSGHTTRLAVTGADAARAIAEGVYDAVTLDRMLPDTDAYEPEHLAGPGLLPAWPSGDGRHHGALVMRRIALLTLAAVALIAARDGPQKPLLLSAGDVDPSLLLPPPPAKDSVQGRSELELLHRVDKTRTTADADDASALGKIKDPSLFAAAMGPGFSLDRLPATRALFATVRLKEKAAVDRGKTHFHRDRPWITDATLHPCGDPENPDFSYPSGHATMAFSMASIMARLALDKAPAIMARAADYAHARVVCERHFPSDVIAGQAYGMIIGERLMETPAFRARFDAAAKELKAAGF